MSRRGLLPPPSAMLATVARRASVPAVYAERGRAGLLGMLFAGMFLGAPPAMAQNFTRLEAAARWAVRAAIPDGIQDWPDFREVRLHPHAPGTILACGILEFPDPTEGRTGFLVFLAPGTREGDEPLSPPVFFGLDGAVPMATLCDRVAAAIPDPIESAPCPPVSARGECFASWIIPGLRDSEGSGRQR